MLLNKENKIIHHTGIHIKLLNQYLVCTVLVLLTFIGRGNTQTRDSSAYKFFILPQKKLIPVFTADARAHRLSIQRNFDQNSYLGSMGGIFPLVQLNHQKKAIQLCVAGTTYMGLLRSVNHGSVLNIDFFVDVYADVKLSESWLARLGTGHTSQHLSDDAIVTLGNSAFNNYARDYYQLLGVYNNKNLRILLYGGIIYNFNFKTERDLSGKSMFQFGFEHNPFKFGKTQSVYYAGDIKFRGEQNYGQTLHGQLGYKYQSVNSRVMRLAVNYSSGLEERGQFYKQNREFASAGLYLEF